MILNYGNAAPQQAADGLQEQIRALVQENAQLRTENAQLVAAAQALVAKMARLAEMVKARAEQAQAPGGVAAVSGTGARVPEVLPPDEPVERPERPEPVTRDQKLKAKDWWRNIDPWGDADSELEIG